MESIEGKYHGPVAVPYSWINLDGSCKNLEVMDLPPDQRLLYSYWDQAMAKGKPWVGADGTLRMLSAADVETLSPEDAARYQAAQIKAKLKPKQSEQAA